VPYLQDLTIRLAEGVGRLPEAMRQRHATFLKAKQNADGGFAGREGGSDLYYTGFALRSLAILGELHGDVAEKAANFVRQQLGGQAAIIDFLSLLYSAMLLDTSAGIDVLAGAPADWPARVAAEIERFRREDGGYAMSHEGYSSSTYYTFLVLLCQQVIGAQPVEPERIVQFVASRRRDDGGFVELGPMKRSGTNPTAAAIGTLKILGAIDPETREGAIDFLAERQTDEGGFAANTRIPFADVLSSFTGTLTLIDLDGLGEIDVAAVRRFIQSLESDSGGFLAHAIDQVADVEYTFYGLGALALLAMHTSSSAG
jgi:geranylgeranyl transferase type-2 subunit beta